MAAVGGKWAAATAKVIMLTGDANQGTLLDAARMQVSGYLVKPVSPKQLADRLRVVFNELQSAPAGS
jgi:two-component system, chemotaxis family, chemotaxis protein CheY